MFNSTQGMWRASPIAGQGYADALCGGWNIQGL